jgi:hypothetical protein
MNWELAVTISSVVLGSSLIAAIFGAYTNSRIKRRELYSKGLYLICEREELYYMILRRGVGAKKDGALVEPMHKNQMKIQEHTSLLKVGSYWLGRSYAKLVSDFRQLSEQKFRDAWKSPLKQMYDSVPAERRLDSSKMLDRYSKDCRIRLNPLMSTINSLLIRWWLYEK